MTAYGQRWNGRSITGQQLEHWVATWRSDNACNGIRVAHGRAASLLVDQVCQDKIPRLMDQFEQPFRYRVILYSTLPCDIRAIQHAPLSEAAVNDKFALHGDQFFVHGLRYPRVVWRRITVGPLEALAFLLTSRVVVAVHVITRQLSLNSDEYFQS